MSGEYTLPGVLLSGTHASRPAASAVANGTLYAETDTGQTYQSDGTSTWTAWGQAAGGSGLTGGTPALTLGTSNSAGAASTGIRTDATIAAFDSTVPVTQAFGDAAATGSAGVAARRDHKHGMPRAIGGEVAADGSISRGTGFTVSHPSNGHYTISFTSAFGTIIGASVVASALVSYTAVIDGANPPTTSGLHILTGIGGTSFNDQAFSFLAIGQA